MSIVERKKEALAYRLSQELDSEKKRSFLIKVAVAGMAKMLFPGLPLS
ncbi:MAG TPA: hypothetical protein VFZ23_18255 [Pyrinomonadaceae bacterium]